jgi:hypothetical protein
MTYKITIKSKGQRRVEEADGVRELHTSLALYRKQGWKIAGIKRVDNGEKMVMQDLKGLVLQ